MAELTETERLEEAAWRTAIALAGKEWDSEWIPCADVENARVREVLKARVPLLAPLSECEVTEASSMEEQLRRRFIHQPTGAPARLVRLSQIEETRDGAEVGSSYLAGSLWACRFTRRGEQWVAQWCGTTEIS